MASFLKSSREFVRPQSSIEKPRINVKNALIQAALVPFVMMAALGVIFIIQNRQLLVLSKAVDQSDREIARAETLQKHFVELETGVRGYLLTGEASFLEPYAFSSKEIPIELDEFDGLTSNTPEDNRWIDQIRQRFSEWMKESKKLIALKSLHRDVLRDLKNGPAQKKMAEVRELFRSFIQNKNTLLNQRRKAVEIHTERGFYGVGLLALFWGGFFAFGIRRQINSISGVYESTLRELVKAQNELAQSHEELENRVRERTAAVTASNAELEAFCYSVSHDLRAPLRGIDGFSQAVLEDYSSSLDSTGKRYLQFVREGVQKMGKLIDDLLELSRLSRAELNKTEVSLAVIASEVISQLEQAEPSRKVRFMNIDEAQGVVLGDVGLLSALMQNLLGNAWKFSANREEAEIQFGLKTENGQPIYFIKDNGAGFDMSYESKLFGAFQRLHSPNEFKGTGVGLATVRRIVHRHGGKIWAQGRVGVGATFFFTLTAP